MNTTKITLDNTCYLLFEKGCRYARIIYNGVDIGACYKNEVTKLSKADALKLVLRGVLE